MKELEVAAQALGLQLQAVQVQAADDLENAFSVMAGDRARALLVLSNPAIVFFQGKVLEFATKGRLPSIYATTNWVAAGRLMSYAPAADQ
jgi:putative tryptophan/tyrosine transport system substrate-binding protein